MNFANEDYNEILDIAMKIDEEKEKHILKIDQLIEDLLGIAQREEIQNDDTNWTPDLFKHVKLSVRHRSVYNTNHGDHTEELYRLGAEIMNFTRGLNLVCVPMVKHIVWMSGQKRLFGINLFTKRPGIAVFHITEDGDMTKEDVEKLIPNCGFTSYPQYSQLVFERGTPLTEVKSLFQEIYSQRQEQ